jgi:hypothetical protein
MRSIRRFWQALVVMAVLACLAMLFGPADRLGVVDVGATGAALFHVLLIGLMLVIAWWPHEVFPEEWSLAEIRAWVGLVLSLLLLSGFGKFLMTLAALETVPRSIGDLPARHFISLLGTLLFFAIVANALLARRGGVQLDERDLRMRYAADQAGDLALALSVINCVILLVVMPRDLLAWWLEPLVLANVLIGLLIFRSFVEQAVLVVRYALARR